MAKVSVIVPVFNTEQYLERCLDSLVNQTLEDIEIVIIDDGSTDKSLQILERYKEKYRNKILLISKENGGQGAARNMGITKCTGEYIGFLDSDDYADLSMYENMWNMANKDNLDLVECRYKYIREENGEELKTYGYVRPYKSQDDMFIDPLVSPWNKLIKADILKQFDYVFPEGLIYEDTSFFIKMIPYIEKRGFVDEAYIFHMLRGTSTMNANKSKKVGDIFQVLEDIITFYNNNDFYEEYKNELEYFCVKILLCSSIQRISKVSDKKLRNQFINKTFDMIEYQFPQYKDNPYIQGGKKNLYMRKINRITVKLLLPLFRRMGD